MIARLNPVIIAGFDILFLGKKGFSSLARAKTILVRTKAKKGEKPQEWIRLDVSKYRKKADKEKVLYRLLQKLSFKRDLPKKEKKPKKKPRAKEVETTEDIQFKLTDTVDKVITNQKGKKIEIKKLVYELPKAIGFVQGRNYKPVTVQQYINAVKREFKKIHKKYGKTEYFIRLHHQYKGLPSRAAIDPNEKGFGGYALHRQLFKNQAEINDQFDEVLSRSYPESFSRYLRFSTDSTSFDFTGFMVEVVTDELE